MKLDFHDKTNLFTLRVPRKGQDITRFVEEHGLNYSTTQSSVEEACLYTDSIYAAMTYAQHATPNALDQFKDLLPELEASRRLEMTRKVRVPDGVDLYPFQKAAVDYVLRRTNSLIGDSPGLGKTPMAIVVANEMRAKRVLVVCPASIRLQWQKQIHVWSTMPGRFITYPILKTSDGVHPNAEWTIVSYDLLRSTPIWEALNDRLYDLIIIDEAHYLKTSRSGRAVAMFGNSVREGLSGRAGSILALTGTPLPNRPKECFTIAKALCHDSIDFMDEKSFCERYNPTRVGVTASGGRYTEEKSGRLFELQNRLRTNFMIRRLKRDVLPQLPEITYSIIHVEETGEIKKALEAERVLDIDPNDLRGVDAKILGHISTVRMMMGIAKAPLAADYANMIMEGGEEKLVIFGWHIGVLDILEERLHKWNPVRVDGSTGTIRRQQAVDNFINDPEVKVFIGNLQSIGTGVDGLQNVCSRGLFAECDWVPGNNFEQGVGRLERIGQKSGIFIEFLVAPGSLDERVLGSALKKLKDIHSSLDERI